MSDVKYHLTMNEEQADLLVRALDSWIRMRIGQWKELVDLCFDYGKYYKDNKTEEYCKDRDKAEEILLEARKIVFPELRGSGHSYGVYEFEETERAFNILKAVRRALAYHKKPEGGWTVEFDPPFAFNVKEEMPSCEALDNQKLEKEPRKSRQATKN